MKFFRPKSISRLILVGFSLVALPLIVALVIATFSVDRLVRQSQSALYQSVLVTHGSQTLVETITAMERNVRQYQVLGDKALFDVYDGNHAKFVDIAEHLEKLRLEKQQRILLEELFFTENEIHAAISGPPHDSPEIAVTVDKFTELSRIAKQILADNRDLINRELEQIQQKANTVQQTLVIQSIALVPIVIILALVATLSITRPINQIDRAIRRLGDGKFGKAAKIDGPRDLQQLGERLNWLQYRLQELEQEKTKFLHHISHELKTPLTAIREGAELMNEQVAGNLNSQQREIISILHDNSLQLQKLIEDLLDFSTVRSRTTRLSLSQLNLRRLIEEVLANHKVTIFSRQLNLSKTLQSVVVSGDRHKLHTLIDNLLSNAIKYSPDKGPLWILLHQRDQQAIIEVANAGPEIPENEQEQIFEAFYQGKPAVKGHVRGSGLGLSIAREYAEAHGGAISVVESTNAGTRFRVVLPVAQESINDAV
ncbi:MAG: HAMP domain-containing sensor histidine kinase [Pseudomonadota bacterium]